MSKLQETFDVANDETDSDSAARKSEGSLIWTLYFKFAVKKLT